MRLLFACILLCASLRPAASVEAAHPLQETVTPIDEIQSQFSNGDDSTLAGETVTIRGIVTGVFGDLFFVEEASGGPWSGIAVYKPGHSAVTGDDVRITGRVTEFYDLTEIEPGQIEILSSNHPLPAPHPLSVQEAQNEQWEGVLVRVSNVEVVSEPDQNGEWQIRDGSGRIRVDDKGVYYAAMSGQPIAAITAVVDHAFGSYRLIPRNLDDIGNAGSLSAALPDDLTPIFAIQGRGPVTPLEQERVDTYGLVTAVGNQGFFLQDPAGDGDPETSDGVYVYTGHHPIVEPGQCVLVQKGSVSEYYDKTELSQAQAIRSIDSCGAQTIEPTSMPAAQLNSDPALLFERYEGMLVEIDGLEGIVQGPTKRFSNGEAEIAIVDQDLLPYLPGQRVYQAQPADTSALIYLSNNLGAELPDAAWGDRLLVDPGPENRPVRAVLDYNFGKYQLSLLPGQQVTVAARQAVQDPPLLADSDEFSVCTFNLLGLGRGGEQYRVAAEYDRQLRKRAKAIAEGLQDCIIIGLEETGTPEDARNLADLLGSEYDLDYTVVSKEGPGSFSLEFPLTNSLLARTDRVEVLKAELIQGCSQFSYDVRYTPGACPSGQYALFNRPPLVVDLAVGGDWGAPYKLTVIVNHWKSKGGDEAVNVVRRTLQAVHVAGLVQARLDEDAQAQVVVLGDLNDYYTSGPVETLQKRTTPSLVHVYDFLSPLDRYTYIYNGASQALDHILITAGMQPEFAGIDPVHIDADFPETGNVDLSTIHHASDHDPVKLVVRPEGAGWIRGNVGVPGVRVELMDQGGQTIDAAISDALGFFQIWGVAPGPYRLAYTAPPHVELAQPPDLVMTVVAGQGRYMRPGLSHRSADWGEMAAILSPGWALSR